MAKKGYPSHNQDTILCSFNLPRSGDFSGKLNVTSTLASAFNSNAGELVAEGGWAGRKLRGYLIALAG